MQPLPLKKGTKVLILEDDRKSADVISRIVMETSKDASVFHVEEPDHVQVVLTEDTEDFDLIITSYHPSGACGNSFLEWLQKSGVRKTPVMVITSIRDVSAMRSLINEGVASIINKPFNQGVLANKLRELLCSTISSNENLNLLGNPGSV